MAEGVLSERDRDAIEQVVRTTLGNITDGDRESWLGHWTQDARLMPPGRPDVTGHDQLAAWIRDWPPVRRFEVESMVVEGAGDLAVAICSFVRVTEDAAGAEERQPARQVLKLRRQPDGTWLIAAAIFNARQ
ncbi:DUF4440 domain-containing protein [Ruegeria sediminis]|uniref:DUF4440 domain-containing protein n=1 Tax=Ruegeria sediminis TaxID=2583820 RepID=A0ABY2X2L5_9RHOB|nr:DUF4440 domain-containing protein [Ruegeria sediminis]TMV09605.1 DUF4440 domain-containing protein [Ruegeria sediminis]